MSLYKVSIKKAEMLSLLCSKTYKDNPWQVSDKLTSSLRNQKIIKPSESSVSMLALSGILGEELVIAFRGTVMLDKAKPLKLQQEALINMICSGLVLADHSHFQDRRYDFLRAYEGMVHPGFAWFLEEFLPDIQYTINSSNAKQICLTGHSLGGALATLAAYRLINNFPFLSVYTFGSPRVGDQDFKVRYKRNKIPHFRFENRNDIIPHLPPHQQHRDSINKTLNRFFELRLPDVNYEHVGILQFINWEGHLVENSVNLPQQRLEKCFREINRIFLDHDIDLYSQSLEKINSQSLENIGDDMQGSLNVLVIGKTGSGKSSLINYLYGSNIAKTGLGRPVTQGRFDKFNIDWENIKVEIYDSVGLEVGDEKAQKWLVGLNNELKRHGVHLPASQWFHAVIYCINAGGHRIEPYEDKIIEVLISNNYRVVIVVTNSDKLTNDEIFELVRPIKEKFDKSTVPIVSVCSVEKKNRDGSVTREFGLDRLETEILKGFWYAITIRLPDRCEYLLLEELKKWNQEQKRIIRSNSDGFDRLQITQKELAEKINGSYSSFLEKFETLRKETLVDEINTTIGNFRLLAEKLKYLRLDFEPIPKEPIITLNFNFLEDLKEFLSGFRNSVLDWIVDVLNLVGKKDSKLIVQQLDNRTQELEKFIKDQKPEISQLIRDMLKEKGVNIAKLPSVERKDSGDEAG
jgi:GTP-binding protein EngB required for normal cell division